MTISFALLALLAQTGTSIPSGVAELAPTPTVPVVAAAPTPESKAAATDAARRFLAMLDRDDWSASWHATHKSFQLLNTVDWWAQASQSVRGRIGNPISRELATVDFTAAPPNGYWIIAFKAGYSKKHGVTETLHMASEGDGWKVAAITVD